MRLGRVYILPTRGRYQVLFDDHSLGRYYTPEDAADQAARGAVERHPAGIDLGDLGLSSDIADWTSFRF